MAAIGEFIAGVFWIVMFGVIIAITFALGVLLLSGLVHLIAYLNKQSRRKQCP